MNTILQLRKKKLYVLFSLLILAGCSEYPTSGVISVPNLKNDPVKVSGKVYEISSEIEKNMQYVFSKTDFIEDHVNNNKTTLPKNVDIPDDFRSDLDSITDLNMKIRTDLANQLSNWKENLTVLHEQEQSKLLELLLNRNEYESHMSDAINEQEKLEKILEDNQTKTNEIIKTIVDKTNEIIVSEKIAIRKVSSRNYTMRFKVKSLSRMSADTIKAIDCFDKKISGTGFGNPNRENYIDLKLAAKKECVYATRPARNLQTEEYDNFLRGQVKDMLALDTDKYTRELRELKKALKKEHIVAENQTGINYKNLLKKISQSKKLSEVILELKELPVDMESIGSDLTNLIELEKQVNLIVLNSTGIPPKQKIPLSLPNFGSVIGDDIQQRNRLKAVIQEQLRIYLDVRMEILLSSYVVAETDINEKLEFSGLDGKEKYLAMIVSIDQGGFTKINARQIINTEDPQFNRDSDLVIKLNESNSVRDAMVSYKLENMDELLKSVLFDYLKENRP
ncbi:hypothetical protein [Marinicella sp. W31]|uniref:hypothetical protein n=1 Tax=Marinicella sp. W31 TaxID=3023713 RepID=UPI0037577832